MLSQTEDEMNLQRPLAIGIVGRIGRECEQSHFSISLSEGKTTRDHTILLPRLVREDIPDNRVSLKAPRKVDAIAGLARSELAIQLYRTQFFFARDDRISISRDRNERWPGNIRLAKVL